MRKLLYLGLREASKKWKRPIRDWKAALNQFVILEDCFIACVDGLKGLPEAIETVFPHARVQLCIVHQVRKSLRRTAGGLRDGTEEAALPIEQ